MDWTFPHTLYPSALPSAVVWLLFLSSCLLSAILLERIHDKATPKRTILLALPVCVGVLIVSILLGVALTFFLHDL